jgi:hypothetical protein
MPILASPHVTNLIGTRRASAATRDNRHISFGWAPWASPCFDSLTFVPRLTADSVRSVAESRRVGHVDSIQALKILLNKTIIEYILVTI